MGNAALRGKADVFDLVATGDSSGIDVAELSRAIPFLLPSGEFHELRGLPSGRSRIVGGDHRTAIFEAAGALADDRGLYYSLNPVRPDLGDRAARKADVVRRTRLLIDVDRRKGEADRDLSATEAEREACWRVALSVWDKLTAAGWPDPVVVDSGNGWHLVYAIDLAADDLARQWIGRCLKALAEQFDTSEAEIDVKVHDAPRVAKLPGSKARKGPDTPDRPHRWCRIAYAPAELAVVPADLIRELAGIGRDNAEVSIVPFRDPFALTASAATAGNSAAAYARSALEREIGRVFAAPAGSRNNTLHVAAVKLGGLVASGDLPRATVETQLAAAATAAGLDEAETGRAIRNGLEVNAGNPRKIPERANGRPSHAVVSTIAAADAPGPLTIRASEITPLAVKWLWRNRIATGFITVFAGRTGLGKSFVLCDLAARLTTGSDLPDGKSGRPGECCNVLFISEDPYEYVLAPRLLALDADMSRVSFLRWEALASYTLENIAMLDRAWHEAGQPVLVAIDPPTNFLGGSDEHKNAEVRRVLMAIVAWLNGREVACVLITHVNKQSGKGVEALNRIIGSVAWTTTSRVAMAFAPDPGDPTKCLFASPKNNLGPLAKTLAYRIAPAKDLAVVEWLGEVDTSADEAMSGEARPPRAVAARGWLIDRFRERLEWPSEELFEAGRKAGVSKNAIYEAKKDPTLQLPPAIRRVTAEGVMWLWCVPANWIHLQNDHHEDGGTPF